jgi:short-subunit dehydrogenase
MRKTLVIGATSAIAEATARLLAEEGDALFLIGRSAGRLEATAEDLKLRGAAGVHTEQLDVLDYDRHQHAIDAAIRALDGLDLVLIAHGTLPDQRACEQSFASTRREFEINALSTISLLTRVANYFERERRGVIAVISSVAGDRGRQSNYVYGSAKGTVSIFLQGLRNRLYRSGVHVLTIKPGFVDTPMTKDFKKGLLWSDAEAVAKRIVISVKKQKDVAYAPRFWRGIMLLIRLIPERVFKKLNL